MINQCDFLKELKMCLHELSLMDDTMEAVGLPNKFKRLRKWTVRITIGCFVYMFLDSMRPSFYSLLFNLNIIITTITFFFFNFFFSQFVYVSSALIWGTSFGYINFRFHQVNDRLHVFYSKFFENDADYRRQNRSNSMCQRITETEDRKQCIWIIM
ncbi:hypothetical protein ALC57_09488 [Trachymyrmex cornetzi]|uniref:Uncharacterized protein n=1 Tax=Trachymyrmex cornetzi TaxID=471704 RepID=A0A151J5C0_9HYME|nr:hypothetical protein ALC57_09488 [Trachymyrmex cornetzi]